MGLCLPGISLLLKLKVNLMVESPFSVAARRGKSTVKCKFRTDVLGGHGFRSTYASSARLSWIRTPDRTLEGILHICLFWAEICSDPDERVLNSSRLLTSRDFRSGSILGIHTNTKITLLEDGNRRNRTPPLLVMWMAVDPRVIINFDSQILRGGGSEGLTLPLIEHIFRARSNVSN